jgi:hypothetical protein
VFISKKAVVGSPVQIQERLNSDSMNDSSNQFQVSAVPSSVAKEHQNEILGEFVSLQNTNVDTSVMLINIGTYSYFSNS